MAIIGAIKRACKFLADFLCSFLKDVLVVSTFAYSLCRQKANAPRFTAFFLISSFYFYFRVLLYFVTIAITLFHSCSLEEMGL
jgi:hypothetical protein